MDLETRIIKWIKRSLLLIAILVSPCLLCFVTWRFRVIALDIPKPPGTQITVTYQRDSLYLVWEEQALIPESAFESPEEVQQYYTTELAEVGWFPLGEDDFGVLDILPNSCNNRVTGLTDDQRRYYSLQLYSTEGGLTRYAPGPPRFLCLYVKDFASNGVYTVKLLSLRPTFFAELNA